MKYTIEEKKRLQGMDGMIQLKQKICKDYNLRYNEFKIKGDYIVIESKINSPD